MKHLINSLKFDLHCPQEEQAFALRQEVMQHLQPMLMECMESVCAAHLAEDVDISMETLEIDLGRMSTEELKMQFGAQFREQFELKLLQCLAREGNEQENDTKHTSLQLFSHFMKTGRLPWWAAGTTPDLDELGLQLTQQAPEAILRFFIQHRRIAYVWERVIKQLDYRFQEFLLSSLEPFINADKEFITITAILKQQLQLYTDPVAATVSDELLKLERDHRIWFLEHAPVIFQAQEQYRIKEVVADLTVQQLFPAGQTEREALAAQLKKMITAAGKFTNEKTALPDEPTAQSPETASQGSDRQIIQDAGLVLLGPFLKPFFSALGFWQDQQWTSDEARERAACLLRFMATGQQFDKEYNLVLEKLLCGIPLHQPIYTGFEFTGEEIKEAESLLASVIVHWQALKNTSVEGFRSSFLLREAVLFRKEQDWQLVVEKKTLDILLESIPWGYGALSLSWNEYLIFTEW